MVTKVALQVPPAPKAVNVAVVGLESFEKVQEVGARVGEWMNGTDSG